MSAVQLCLDSDFAHDLRTDRCTGIDLAHVWITNTYTFCHLCQLVPTDIGLHSLLPFLEERTVLRKGQAFALLLLPYALRFALDSVLAGLADLGKDNTCHPVDEGIRLRLVTTERQFVEGGFVDNR